MIEKAMITELDAAIGYKNVLLDASMKDFTSFKIGGNADVLVTPYSPETLKSVFDIVKKYKVPYFVMGNGSNLLVLDGGIRGVVINTFVKFNAIRFLGKEVSADCGVLLSTLANSVMKKDLAGLEFAAGIPGTVGGAVWMNAGAYGGEIKDVIVSATVLDGSEIIVKTREELGLDYRKSAVARNKWMVLEARFGLTLGNKDEIYSRMQDLARRRREKQPLTKPSAGSAFKRPVGGYASQLIDEAGLKGVSIGGAQVSLKHAGFVINSGGATANDVLDLLALVKKKVYENSGIELSPEIRIVGEEVKK